MTIEPMPGSAEIKPVTTLRSEGTTLIKRNTLKILSARNTDRPPVAGNQAMMMIVLSNMDHGSVKKVFDEQIGELLTQM